MKDNLNPSYYKNAWSNGAELIDITENLNFCRGNAVKYIARAGAKSRETEIEDLKKALWYINRELTLLEASSKKAIGPGKSAITPDYYNKAWSNGTALIDVVEHLNFCRGNAIKYVARAGVKSADREKEDLEKARWYLNREIGRLEDEKDSH